MIRRSRAIRILVAVLSCGLVAVATRAAEPRAAVDLLADADAIAPGASVELALRFRIAEGWHVYWRDPGDSGLAPTVKWQVPPGFEVGPLRFPGPTRHKDAAGLVTNVLEGDPVLLATLRAAEGVEAETVTIGAEFRWLACQKVCVMESQTVELRLPMAASAEAVKRANEDVFGAAVRTHPVAPEKARAITVSASVSEAEVKPGDAFDLTVLLSVKKGYHIQSHTPIGESFIATDMFIDRPAGLRFEKPVFPAGKTRSDRVFGRVREYDGEVPVRVKVKVADDFAGESAKISGVVLYQACDKTTCFPPEYVSWSVPVAVVGGRPAPQAGAEAVPVAEASAEATATDEVDGAAEKEAEEEPVIGGGGLEEFLGRLGLPGLLAACFLYGLFLNATPCVFPLLSVKVLGFVQQAHESRGRTLVLGLAFGAGVLVFFVILGFLAAQGQNVLQYPVAVIALGAIVMALALSMLGVYTLQVPTTASKLDAAIQQEGLGASFGKGTLAPILGFACTGPLLAGAFGWATQQPAGLAFLAFLLTGLGMASPYMLLGANPQWLSFLPRAGPWMLTFERIMGFLLLGMVLWLLYPLIHHIGANGLLWTLGFFVVIGMACWVWGKVDLSMPAGQRWRYRGTAGGFIVVGALLVYGVIYPLGEAQMAQNALRAEMAALRAGSPVESVSSSGKIAWREWTPEAVEEAVRGGKMAFVDFTAAYCTVCKTNKKVAVNTPEVIERIASLGVVAFQGDFTSGDDRIFRVLQKHKRAGVPLNLIYPAGKPDSPIVLRPNLTKQYLLDKLDEAGPSKTPE